jgi:WD40 repeat protein
MVLKTLKGHTDAVTKLRFSPTGEELVSASHDRWVRIWDKDGEELGAFQPEGDLLGIGISPDGAKLATVPFDGPVELWDLDSTEKVAELGGTGGYDTSDAVFSPNGQFLAADLATGLFLWRVSDGELVWNDVKNSMAAAFSPDGRYLAYSDVDDRNKVFLSTPDGAQKIRTLEGTPGGPVWELVFSPDSSMLASTDGAEMRIWGVEDGRLLYIGKPDCP